MKRVRIIKRVLSLLLIFLLSINSIAAIVSDNDGSAFITKAEFDALKSNFQSQIDTYNQSIDSKIDGAIASYLAGIKLSSLVKLDDLYGKYKITGVTYDGGALYWSADRTGLLTKSTIDIGWKASIAYAVTNIQVQAGTYQTSYPSNGAYKYTDKATVLDFKKDFTNNLYVEKNGIITRASNRQYWMNSSLIWQGIGRNLNGDLQATYEATGWFDWASFKSDTKINRNNGTVWSCYVGVAGRPQTSAAATYGYTSFSIEDLDLGNTVCAAIYAGDNVYASGGTKYYVDNLDKGTIDLENTGTNIDIYTEATSYTMTTPTGSTGMTHTAGQTLKWPGSVRGKTIIEEREPNTLKFKDFQNICDKNDQIKNGICVVDQLPNEGPLNFEFDASAAGTIMIYSGLGTKLDYSAKKDMITKDVAVGLNIINFSGAVKGDYVAIRYIPTSGVGKLSNFVITQTIDA